MQQQTQSRSDGQYYVEGYETRGFARLSDCRSYAGTLQVQGVHRSLPIMQNGQVVDLKRY